MLDLLTRFQENRHFLTEGAVGLRLSHEYGLVPDSMVGFAGMIYSSSGRAALTAIYNEYLSIAKRYMLPILLMTNTRRANRERVSKSTLSRRNPMRDYALFLKEIADKSGADVAIGGIMGQRGDAYRGDQGQSTEEAEEFHSWQVEQFRNSEIDFLFAGIMPTLPEAVGMSRAMETLKKPYIVSFMVESSGKLLDKNPISAAIREIDSFAGQKPLCYMANCVYPLTVKKALDAPENQASNVRERFLGIQANAANVSVKQLDGRSEPVSEDANTFCKAVQSLHKSHPLKIYGGCCGTNASHLEGIASFLSKEMNR